MTVPMTVPTTEAADYPFTGLVTFADAATEHKAYVMAVDRANLGAQYSTKVEPDGRFALSVPAGCYDVLFHTLDEPRYSTFHVGVFVSAPTVFNVMLTRPGIAEGIAGNVVLPVGDAAGFETAARPIAQKSEPADGGGGQLAAVDGSGNFVLAGLQSGYYLVTVKNSASGVGMDVMVPLGDRPVVLAFDARQALAPTRHVEDLGLAKCACEPRETLPSWIFTQSAPFGMNADVHFTDGSLELGAAPPVTTNMTVNYAGTTTSLCVYLTKARSLIYDYCITVDTLIAQTGYCKAVPMGSWDFTDKTGDTYLLLAFAPYPHIVQYNSADPTIISARFNQEF